MMWISGTTKNKLAMVDLDGTLVDTLESNFSAYREALYIQGYELTKKEYARNCDGRSYKEFLPEIIGDDINKLEQIHQHKCRLYSSCMQYAKVNNHLVNILSAIKGEYYIALVTTASKENANKLLVHFNLLDMFDLIVTQEDVKKPKPNPECYFKTMKYFGIGQENAIIFEDSEFGIQAAKKSGCNIFCYKGASVENQV